MLKSLRSKVVAVLAGLAVTAAAVAAVNSFYAGFLLQTNQYGIPGLEVSGGTHPVVSGTVGCGTITGVVGGTARGEFVLGTFATSCAITLTLPVPAGQVDTANGFNVTPGVGAPNGLKCTVTDLTTPADTTTQASYTTTSSGATACVFSASTFVTGDKLQYTMGGY